MITPQGKKSIEQVFQKAARQNLGRSAEDKIQVQILSDSSPPFTEKKVILFTISSFIFRLLTIFHVEDTAAMREYYLDSKSDRSLLDVFYEYGNLCCGAMNRDLVNHFGHLGMSTPYLLERDSIVFLKDLKPGHTARFELRLPNDLVIHATVSMCENAPIDFKFDDVVEESTGELEFF